MDKGYFYECNHCGHLEQGFNRDVHRCKKVSYNRYQVQYDKNSSTATGSMVPSRHMYNNATSFNGETVTSDKYLSKCNYTREGYVFMYWTTNADGTGTRYQDEQEIYNLTTENYDPDNGYYDGVITLYAQWKRSESTLIIDANGGVYNDSRGSVSGDRTTYADIPYGQNLALDTSKLTAPMGYKVSFNTHGGTVQIMEKRLI